MEEILARWGMRDFYSLPRIEGCTGHARLDSFEKIMQTMKVGSRGMLCGNWASGEAHIFAWVRTKDGYELFDPQVKDWAASITTRDNEILQRFNQMQMGSWRVWRVDNKNIDLVGIKDWVILGS